MTTDQKRPRTIGDWAIVREIKGGGQARVFQVVRGEGEPIHALKLITSRHSKKRARFAQEVKKHKELVKNGARNIITIVDDNLGDFEGGQNQGFIVMPLAETTLEREASLLKGRVELCLEVFEGIVRGVAEAHSQGVIHRDLKPPNILFQDRSLKIPLIADFGICLVKGTPQDGRLTMPDETVGARLYMAPEQERGGVVDVGETADLYALGKILAFMLSGQHIYREEFENVFSDADLRANPRLVRIRDKILARTINYNPENRIQTAQELLRVVQELREEFGGPSGTIRGGGGTGSSTSETPTMKMTLIPGVVDQLGLGAAYRHALDDLTGGSFRSISLAFDSYRKHFRSTWVSLRASLEKDPQSASIGIGKLIRTQTETIGTTLAIARVDATEVLPELRKYLEAVTRSSEEKGGFPSVNSVPHAYAGYLYMVASVGAFLSQSWNILSDLMRKKFEWYYQSDRPLYSFGFDHAYFFHAEALQRKASAAHDLFRSELTQPEMLEVLDIEKEEALNAYLQTQMLMSLRAAQESESGADVSTWPDFGRFYQRRVRPLVERIREDDDFAQGVLKSFGEASDEWFTKLNTRLEALQSRYGGSSEFSWQSIERFEEN